MKKLYIILFLISCLIVFNGCTTVTTEKLSKQEIDSLKTVSLEYPVISGNLRVWCALCAFTWVGEYNGIEYTDLNALHEAVYLDNEIDITQIVYEELIKHIKSNFKLRYAETDGDLVIKTEITQYGFGPPSPFSPKLSPSLSVRLSGLTNNNKVIWQSNSLTTMFSSVSDSYSNYDLVHKPQIILKQYRAAAKEATKDALDTYDESVKAN
ncbi:MAG: hypothetical protein ABW092_03015 [Candidatus Thiodiazotropha sp.]